MIPDKESQYVEFKQAWHDDYLKHICAFANGQGGRLYLGISDDGTVIGVNNAKKLLEDIPNKVIQRLGITVDVELKDYNHKDLIEIIVNPVSVPISYHGKY